MRQGPNIIVFGGSFDPPHIGHMQCILKVRKEFPQSKILVIPTFVTPPVGGVQKCQTISFHERVQLLKIALFTLPKVDQDFVELCTIEADLPAPNYTFNTLVYLESIMPGKTFGLLIGSDQYNIFSTWYQPSAIREKASLVVIQREGEEKIQLDSGNASGHFFTESLSPAKSSLIREYIRTKKAIPDGWLSEPVRNYIQTHHLYEG